MGEQMIGRILAEPLGKLSRTVPSHRNDLELRCVHTVVSSGTGVYGAV